MESAVEAVSRAVALDEAGAPGDALRGYAAALHGLLSCDASAQASVLARMCAERLVALTAPAASSPDASPSGVSSEGERYASRSGSVPRLDAHARDSPPPGALRPVARTMDASLSGLRRSHEASLVAARRLRTDRIAGGHGAKYLEAVLAKRRAAKTSTPTLASALPDNAWLGSEPQMRSALEAAQAAQRAAGCECVVLEPLVALLASQPRGNALVEALRDSIAHLRERLHASADNTDAVVAEVRAVEGHVADVLQPGGGDVLRGSVVLSIQHYVFSTAAAPALLARLRRVHAKRDDALMRVYSAFGWEDLASRLGFTGALLEQLRPTAGADAFPMAHGLSGPLHDAASVLGRLCSEWTPAGKAAVLVRFCSRLALPGAGLVGSDDLLMLAAYAIVAAQHACLAAEVAFVAELVPEELLRGEAGYALATVETAIDYLIGLA